MFSGGLTLPMLFAVPVICVGLVVHSVAAATFIIVIVVQIGIAWWVKGTMNAMTEG